MRDRKFFNFVFSTSHKLFLTAKNYQITVYRQGNINGFEIDFMIFMHSVSNPLPFSKGEVYKRDACHHAKQEIEVQFFVLRSSSP